MPDDGNWQQWTGLNRQLLDQWRKLLAADPRLLGPSPDAGRAAEQFAALTALSDDVLAVFETTKGCTYLSPNWERLTGRSAASCMGTAFYACLHADHAKPFITALTQVIADDRSQMSLYPLQFAVLHADESPRWYSLKLGEVKILPDGRSQVTCVLRDAHEALEAQRAAREAQREAQVALKARSGFLNAMSHELRTPLNAILGFTQIMENGMYGDIQNPQYREYLSHIRESGYELLAQIDEVMEMAAIDAGAPALSRDVCDLNEMLQQVSTLHRAQAKAAGVTLLCESAAGPKRITADRTRLLHCISHMVANALRFSKAGGQVTVTCTLNETGEVCISVADNGMGMSSRKLSVLLEALQKDDSWAARDTNGLGLGLAMAKEYARMHGGYVTLESKAGQGTRVNVHLPAECVARQENMAQFAA